MTTTNYLQNPVGEDFSGELRQVRVKTAERGQNYDIKIGSGLLARVGSEVRQILTPNARRIFVVSNRKVFDLYGERLVKNLRRENFQVIHFLIGEGERFKSVRTLERVLQALAESGLERSDAILALGGGVVGDLAGLAASLYLRGVAFVNVPTTLLAQIDASVGGKTAVNLPTGKNLVGAFYQPGLVLVDTEMLSTLPPRELTAGWCEAIKQGAVGRREIFDEICDFLVREPIRKPLETSARLNQIVAAQVAFKARIVEGDEREAVENDTSGSRRILNFGHTVGHALEAVTGFRRFRHGEAVGYGMLVAAEISALLNLLDAADVKLLRRAVGLAGTLPPANDLVKSDILGAVTGDKKLVGGSIQWILLERIGKARIVDGREISADIINRALESVIK